MVSAVLLYRGLQKVTEGNRGPQKATLWVMSIRYVASLSSLVTPNVNVCDFVWST